MGRLFGKKKKQADRKDVEPSLPSIEEAQSHLEAGKAAYSGHGSPNDFEKAYISFSFAAQGGIPEAFFWLAVLYEHGRGVEKSMTTAVQMYERAASSGVVGALVNLGALYEAGEGVDLNEQEALKYYLEAASLGSAVAEYNAAVMYSEGRGCTKDMGRAVHYFTMAAKRGFLRACMDLGEILESGNGVKINLDLALEMYERAAEGNEEGAEEAAQALREQLNVTKEERMADKRGDRSHSSLIREVLSARAAFKAGLEGETSSVDSPREFGSRSRAFEVLDETMNQAPPTAKPPPPPIEDGRIDDENSVDVEGKSSEKGVVEEGQVEGEEGTEVAGARHVRTANRETVEDTFGSDVEEEREDGRGEDMEDKQPARAASPEEFSSQEGAHDVFEPVGTAEFEEEEGRAEKDSDEDSEHDMEGRDVHQYAANGDDRRRSEVEGRESGSESDRDWQGSGGEANDRRTSFGMMSSPEREQDHQKRGKELLEEGYNLLEGRNGEKDEGKALSRFLMAAQYGNQEAERKAAALQRSDDAGQRRKREAVDKEKNPKVKQTPSDKVAAKATMRGGSDRRFDAEEASEGLFTDNDLNNYSQSESDSEGTSSAKGMHSEGDLRRLEALLKLWENGLRKHEKTVATRNAEKRAARLRSRDRTLFQVYEEASELASAGFPEAEVVLAEMTRLGLGTDKNGERTVHFLSSAVSKKHSPAMLRLARLLIKPEGKDLGIHRDVKRGIKLLRRAKEIDGDPQCDILLGSLYEVGDTVDVNPRTAMEHYRTAADAGLPEGHYHLAVVLRSCLRRATGSSAQSNSDALIFTDRGAISRQEIEKEAFEHLTEASTLGHVEASWLAGRMVEERIRVVEKNRVQPQHARKEHALTRTASAKELSRTRAASKGTLAPTEEDNLDELRRSMFRFFSTAADRGHSGAKAKIARLYLSGEGIQKDVDRSFTIACSLEKEAQHIQGMPEWGGEAYTVLGLCYKEGSGTEVDDEKAFEYLNLGASTGDMEARLHVALMLRDGRGVTRDEARAASFLKIVAEDGNSEAQYQLALLHLSGKGVAQDAKEAERYLRLASDAGHSGALRSLSRLVKGTMRDLQSEQAKLTRSPSSRSLSASRSSRDLRSISPQTGGRWGSNGGLSDTDSPRRGGGGGGGGNLRREQSFDSALARAKSSPSMRPSPMFMGSVVDRDRKGQVRVNSGPSTPTGSTKVVVRDGTSPSAMGGGEGAPGNGVMGGGSANGERMTSPAPAVRSAEKKLMTEQRYRRKAELESMKLQKKVNELEADNTKLTGQVAKLKKKVETVQAAKEKAEEESIMAKLMVRSTGDEKSKLQHNVEGLNDQVTSRDKRIAELEALVYRLQHSEGELKSRATSADKLEHLLQESEQRREETEEELNKAKQLVKKMKDVAEEAVQAKEAVEAELVAVRTLLEDGKNGHSVVGGLRGSKAAKGKSSTPTRSSVLRGSASGRGSTLNGSASKSKVANGSPKGEPTSPKGGASSARPSTAMIAAGMNGQARNGVASPALKNGGGAPGQGQGKAAKSDQDGDDWALDGDVTDRTTPRSSGSYTSRSSSTTTSPSPRARSRLQAPTSRILNKKAPNLSASSSTTSLSSSASAMNGGGVKRSGMNGSNGRAGLGSPASSASRGSGDSARKLASLAKGSSFRLK